MDQDERKAVRYRIDASTGELGPPVVEHALLFGAVLGVLIGLALLVVAYRGRILWLTVWSVGLVIAGLAYLGAAGLGRV